MDATKKQKLLEKSKEEYTSCTAASVKIDDLSSIKSFDPHGDPSNVGRPWRRWLKSFCLYADSKGLIIQADSADNKEQRRALFLHSAGEDVQEIFETLADTGAAADYVKAEKALNDYFIPKVNSTYQNHVFRSMEQQDGETVAQFVTRLKQVVKYCDYGDHSDNQIRDQVVQRCKSYALRRKLLEKGENLTLARLLTTAATYEAVQSQLASMEGGQHTVNLIRDSRREAQQRKGKEPGKEPKRRVTGKTCKKCGGANHFAVQCKTKSPKPAKPRSSGKLKDTKKKVRYVQDIDEDEDDFATGKIEVFIGGILVEMVVDSGASTNVIDKHLWSELRHEKIECVSKKSNKKLYPYGSKQPLEVLGTFSALTKVGETVVKAEFVVIDGEGEALLGRETAVQLGVLQFGVPVYLLKSKEEILHDNKGIFEGVGKLTGYQVKLHVDPEVPAVAQPVRRTPFSLREKVKEKIEELVADSLG
ncbi:hypothetical protein P5673_012236 [Acropora cervicornis]|uniref:Uncharacterized protein n=1 Tax=Acropora cervicornis TaxID=6130 RepID=A0AAD9QML1_ACRCE|nr:hypothetical protein P5673_012236 [Acropora cervicornis]